MGERARENYGQIRWEKLSESNTFAHIASIKRPHENGWATSFEKINTVKKWIRMQNKQCNGV